MTPPDYDCIIIGGGPAGLTAAIYMRRFHRRILIVDTADSVNSRVAPVPKIRNLVGYDKGISGRALLARRLANSMFSKLR